MNYIFKKAKPLKLSEYYELIYPQYTIFQIIPHTSNRNYDTEIVATTIANMFKLPYQRIQREIKKTGFKIKYELPEKSSFVININKEDCKFYFIVPEKVARIFKEKFSEIWKRVTVKEVESLPTFDGLLYSLDYGKADALSLKINKKNNEPLNNILNVKDILEDDDEVNIFYNFIPVSQSRWDGTYKNTMKRIELDLPIIKDKINIEYIFKFGMEIVIKILDGVLSLIDHVIGDDNNSIKKEVALSNNNCIQEVSRNTNKKANARIIDTQIIIASKSSDQTRQMNNIIAVTEAYKVISEDNFIRYHKLKDGTVIELKDLRLKGVPIMKTSTTECNNFIQIPGRDLIAGHNIQTRVAFLDAPMQRELGEGNISIGTNKGSKSYLPSDYDFESLAMLLLSPQGGGKTTLISNLVKDAHDVGQGNIIPDYIKNCELATAVKSVIPSEDVIDIDLSDEKCFQSLAFNEIKYNGNSEIELFEVANMKAEQTLAFIDAANTDGRPLTGKMRRYLSASANVVYLKQDTSIGDVIKCLSKYKTRMEYIDWVKKTLSEDGLLQYEDYIDALDELNEYDIETDKKTHEVIRKEVVGTKDTKIEGILDRINLIQENIYLKYMLNKKSDNNIDFIKAMEEGKTILIRMPESKFNNTLVKNVLMTFFTSKIVLCTKLRGALHKKPRRCNVFYDELYQAPTSEKVILSVLSQLRKFGLKIVISAHYMDQLDIELKNELKSSGSSYMLLQGSDKKNFDELKEELNPYEIEDLLNLQQYNSLNLIKCHDGYSRFVTKLPPPIRM